MLYAERKLRWKKGKNFSFNGHKQQIHKIYAGWREEQG